MSTDIKTDSDALDRAEKLISQMAAYIGKMAVPADFFADLNEHWIYMAKRKHALAKANQEKEIAEVGFLETRPG